MSGIGRRDFLMLGGVGVTGAAIPAPLLRQKHKPALDVPNNAVVLIEPGAMYRLDTTSGAVMDTGLWAVPETANAAQHLAKNVLVTPAAFQSYVEGVTSAIPDEARAAIETPLCGRLDFADVVTALILGDEALNDGFSFECRYPIDAADAVVPRLQTTGAIPTIRTPQFIGNGGRVRAEDFMPYVEIGNWRFQIMYKQRDVHPFGKCVRVPVIHFHIQVFYRGSYVINLHIGAYRTSARCFVIWDSEHPWFCLNYCNPSIGALQSMLSSAVVFASSLISVPVPAWVVAAIGGAAAGILYVPLLAL